VLLHQPDFSFPPAGGAYRLRFEGSEVDDRIDAVRCWFRDQGRAEFTWWVGTTATPGDLEERLLAAGAAQWEDGLITMMTCTKAPPETQGVEVRRVEQFEDFVLAREIAWEAAELTEEQAREVGATLPQKWQERVRADNGAAYLAYVDGEAVAAADMLFLPFAGFLSGASTRPDYRGRGAFRALVRSRWDEAVLRGTPALIVGAGRMSRPILERIGFTRVAEQRLLVDRSGLSI
jgi:GNAT superfamily N-acetyltransferase